MTSYYSDGFSEILAIVQQLTMGGTSLDTLEPEDLEQFQIETDGKINSILSETYEVPLIKVTLSSGQLNYPAEIQYIARRLVASEAVLANYTEIAPNVSKSAVNLRERAMEDLFEYVRDFVSGRRLQGQRLRARNRFMRPTIFPSKPPETPGKLPSV